MSQDQPDDREPQAQNDQAEISDDDIVIRKIPPGDLKPIGGGRRRVSKAAFSGSSEKFDPERGMSVDLWSALREMGIDPESDLYSPNFEVLMTLSVSTLRGDLGLDVVSRPVGGNDAHCNVLGVRDNKRKPLLEIAGWLRRPDNIYKSRLEADEN